ncbi:helix-turn-helix transcriptional regulator [bacterium]|nr:helix-turn-helix transcriptional regulator [bacterium]
MNIDLVELGKNIKAERNRQFLSQEKLAELIGIQTHHISKIERGLVDIKFTTLIAILKALNLKFEKLYEI